MFPTLSAPELEARRRRIPDRTLPILYFGFAHLCLTLALVTVAVDPRGVAGFYYHPRMLAVVHLVTLGWITCSILGALYLIAPLAMRAPMPATRIDRWAFGLVAFGVAGMVAHFWLDEASGMSWSAASVLTGIVLVGRHFLRTLSEAPIPAALKMGFRLAFFNIVTAGSLGLLMGIDKSLHFLPGAALDRVHGHAHLAALGWATLMVMCAGYRLLPMLLPAAMPQGRIVTAGLVIFEIGVLGLFVTWLAALPGRAVFGLAAVVGIAVFLNRVLWMRQHRKPPARGLPRPDIGVGHALQAMAYLAATAILGLSLAWLPAAEWKLRAIMVYGVMGLLGFLAQMVVGVAGRLLPLFAYLRQFAEGDFRRSPPSPHRWLPRRLQAAVLMLWTVGVPTLAWGLATDHIDSIRWGAVSLLVAVVLSAAGAAGVVRHAFSQPPADPAGG